MPTKVAGAPTLELFKFDAIDTIHSGPWPPKAIKNPSPHFISLS